MERYIVEIKIAVINDEEHGDLIAEKIFKTEENLTDEIKEEWKNKIIEEVKSKVKNLDILNFKSISYKKLI